MYVCMYVYIYIYIYIRYVCILYMYVCVCACACTCALCVTAVHACAYVGPSYKRRATLSYRPSPRSLAGKFEGAPLKSKDFQPGRSPERLWVLGLGFRV